MGSPFLFAMKTIRLFKKTIDLEPFSDWGVRPVVSGQSKCKVINLICEKQLIPEIEEKLKQLPRDIENFEYFCMVVAGCFSIVMKNSKV